MLFTISDEKCTYCGVCAEVCPTRVIEMKDQNAVPVPTADAETRCINCGHCVAVCPHGAFSLESMPVEKCLPVREEILVTPETFEHFTRARRSVRTFKDEPVRREDLAKLINLARFAPTGSNSQEVKWIVVHEKPHVLQISGMVADFLRSEIAKAPDSPQANRLQRVVTIQESGFDYICRGAPHLILAYAPDNRGAGDCIIAATYLELAAFSTGLGPCWGGYIMFAARNNWPELRRFLKVPENNTVYAAMMIGRPRYRYRRLPLRNEAEVKWID